MISNNPAKTVGNVKKVKSVVDFLDEREFEKILSTIDRRDYYEALLVYCFMAVFHDRGCDLEKHKLFNGKQILTFEENTMAVTKSDVFQKHE